MFKILLKELRIMDVKIKEKLEDLFNYLSNVFSSVHSRKEKKDYPELVSFIKGRLLNMSELFL